MTSATNSVPVYTDTLLSTFRRLCIHLPRRYPLFTLTVKVQRASGTEGGDNNNAQKETV